MSRDLLHSRALRSEWLKVQLQALQRKNKIEGSTKRTKLLKKDERNALLESINEITIEELAEKVLTAIEVVHGDYLLQTETQKRILKDLTSNTTLFHSLLEHFRAAFVSLYETYGKGKEKYLRFQLAWHIYSSIFLLPNDIPIETVVQSPTEEMSSIQAQWMTFRQASQASDFCNKLMIILLSSLYMFLIGSDYLSGTGTQFLSIICPARSRDLIN